MKLDSEREAQALAGLLTITGILHFVVPQVYDKIVPPELPGTQRFWVLASGVAELGVAGAVAAPRTRSAGGLLAALLFVVVFPANVYMWLEFRRHNRPLPEQIGALVRLPLQVPLIWWALRVWRQGTSS